MLSEKEISDWLNWLNEIMEEAFYPDYPVEIARNDLRYLFDRMVAFSRELEFQGRVLEKVAKMDGFSAEIKVKKARIMVDEEMIGEGK